MFGPALGSLIYSLAGYEMVFYSFGTFAFIVFFMCLFVIPSSVNTPIDNCNNNMSCLDQ